MSAPSSPHQVHPKPNRRQPTPSEAQMHGKFYLRSKFPRIDPGTNEVYFIISPTDAAHRDQEIKVIVKDGPTVKKDDIIKALNSQAFDVVDLHLTKPAGDDKWQIYRASPPPTENDRKTFRTTTDEKGTPRRVEAFVWTEALDDQIDRFHQYRAFSEASQALSKCMASHAAAGIVQVETAERFKTEAAKLLTGPLSATEDEIDQFVEEQFSPGAVASKDNISNLLLGREEGPSGVRRVYYSPDVSFEKQVDVSQMTEKRHAMSALLNYCAQRSLSSLLIHDIIQPIEKNGRKVSPSEAAEMDMVERRELYAINPLLNSENGQEIRTLEEVELAEIAASRMVRLALHASGADPVSEHADVSKQIGTDGQIVPDKVSCDILAQVAAKGPSPSDCAVDPAAAAQKRQSVVCGAAAQRAEMGKSSILRGSSGIIWQQLEGGAVRPPFSLSDENRFVQTLAQINKAGSEIAKEYVAPAIVRCAEFGSSLTDPVRIF